MLKLNGKTLNYDVAFEADGIKYPANWLRLTTLAEKQAIGITEVANTPVVTYDQRFYWGYEIPKDHSGLVDLWVSKVKRIARDKLSTTDWMVIRAADSSSAKPLPDSVKTERELVRTKAAEKEAAIKATKDTAELETYVNSWAYGSWNNDPEQSAPSSGSSSSSSSSSNDSSSTDAVFE